MVKVPRHSRYYGANFIPSMIKCGDGIASQPCAPGSSIRNHGLIRVLQLTGSDIDLAEVSLVNIDTMSRFINFTLNW